MASILAKILDGKITSEDLTDPHETLRNEGVKGEEEKLEQCNIAELVPFLLNYLREKASHHLTPRQSAAITPKKTSVSQAKRSNSASEQTQHAAKNSRGNLFPSQKTPSPSPVTPLSQSRRDKMHEYRSSSSSSPHVRRKSPKAHGNDRDRQSQLVTQAKLNIDDPDDFPPMGSASKKVTPSRRITPTQVKSDGKKGKVSPAFSSSPFSSPHTVLESYGSPASLQEERNMLKLERARKKNKGDFTWGNRTSPSPQSSVRSPPPHVLGDFIVSPPKQSTTSDHLEKSHSKPNDSLLSTPSPCKDPSGENCSDNGATGATSPQQFEEETHKEKAQFIQVDKYKVVFRHKLDALAKVYSRCILANLVPNVTAELYFVMQLLTARGIVSEQQQDSENGTLGEIHSQNILGSIHNCAYFAVAVLQEIQRLILLLDKETLHLLADNPRIADFSPSLKETFLQQYKTSSVTKVSLVNFIKSPLGGVPFSVERDNKQNFPTERAFHNFNKQRLLKMQAHQVLVLVLFASELRTAASSAKSEFVAAVYEHAFVIVENRTVVPPQKEAVGIVMQNMDVFEAQMKKAAEQNANIIVFPEYGLTGFGYTRQSFRPFLENIPDPEKVNWNACQDPQANSSCPILHRLSCLARTYNMYLVANMGDLKPCNKSTDEHCPADGRYQYNTNVVFDDKGKLVARYHKQHPFLNEMKVVDRPLVPEYITFETPFGKFGTFICFDALFHDPAVPLVTEYKVDHIVFPTAWFDVLPLFAAIGFHGSWARGMEVNFLGANTHVPRVLSTGSGIYSPTGAKKYYRSLSSNGSLSVAALSRDPKNMPHNISVVKSERNPKTEDSFYSDLFGDLFFFKKLSKAEGTLDACYNGSDICCSLTYKMAERRADEMYALGVFDGLHTREGQYYLRICTLIKCLGLSRDSCGQRTYSASTIFESFTLQGELDTPYVYPQVVADGVSLLPGEWDHNISPVTHLQSKQQLSKGLLTAALFGRVYELDDGSIVESSAQHFQEPLFRAYVYSPVHPVVYIGTSKLNAEGNPTVYQYLIQGEAGMFQDISKAMEGRKRDVFYELVRKWEDSHSVAGWNMEEHMGDRIRALVNQKPEIANYSHFARLFKSQLLQMCEEERNGSDFRSSSMLSNLQKSNPEKFQRLQERFITPLSTSGPCPSPSFSNVQEFFKGFIQSAASHSFNQHLIDLLIVKITEIDDKEFPLLDIEVSEKDLSIQNKELKADFSCCLMNVRILAKFLGFLLFQPYYGAETTSQVITTETLKIRNRIPIQFDILSYLKKAWYSGRLVLTIPWAMEYLSMMDPLAPHLDYFSGVLYWLQRIYRERAAQSAKNDLNHSRLLLVSCLGWFFEIPVIPVSFFFKSLTDSKQPIDEHLKSTSSDVKVSLDSIGIVDQGILYSCCPYLGEIRSVLVEAAAGLSGRAGPVKKITPVSAGEPARISSSQRQLQLQLEENFFRIQPDFLKRLSDFTLERLCSNIISHVKGNIIPSLLGRGVQSIQEFLDNEFSGNTNTDQAKEKCRPRVLKIIHSVTDDGVKAALETVESSKQKSLSAFESLCPQEMNSKVIMTAANITTRLIKEKTSDWINTCLPNIMEEGLFVQFDKIANSILNSKSKEQRIRDSQSDANTKQIPENVCEVKAKCCKQLGGCLPESATPAMKVKALQAVLSEQSKLLAMQSPSEITPEVVAAVVAFESTLISEGQSYAKEMALIGQITVELVFILVCRTAYGVTVVETNCTKNSCGILDKLTKLWTRLKERRIEVPFERLLSSPHVNLIMTLDNRKVVFEALQALFLSLIRKHLIFSHEVEQWYSSALRLVTDEGTAVELCTASCCLVLAYHEARKRNGSGDESHKTVHQAEFSLLLAALKQRFPHNSSVSSLLSECVKNNPGVIVISDDSAIN